MTERVTVPRFARGRRKAKTISAYSQLTEERKEQIREAARRRRARDPEKTRAEWRAYHERRMAEAGATPKPDRCEVCNEGGKICADHDHATGKFRGWICQACNLTLGKVKDDLYHLMALAEYLEARS